MKFSFLSLVIFCCSSLVVLGQHQNNPNGNHGNKFEQLGTLISDPNVYRSASGAPGPRYWQQRADYEINVELDDVNQRITGTETVTYFNNSPDPLTYIWLQLDENEHHPDSDNQNFDGSRLDERMSIRQLQSIIGHNQDLGVKITRVTDGNNAPLTYLVNQTMMRIEMPKTLQPGERFRFRVDWNYNIPNRINVGGRGGYEYFAEDGNYLYTIAQWFPRLAVYSDFQGWQNKQFTGRGEFALTFGNYKVNITVPADHIVGSTGVCQNYNKVLTAAQLRRYNQSQNAAEPVEVVTLEEARQALRNKATAKKTWTYHAENVRDFAFVSSRRLVWDAMGTDVQGKKVMAMSYYGPEAYPLYRRYSTKVVAHTLKVYSRNSLAYPYPVAISVEAANGMEYPMICFNYGRADQDGTYTEAIKNGMIGVIIHEVGHNYFPMIVNSDERQWSWMDEGLNSFVQYLAQQEWDPNFPSQRGPAHKIVDYMKLPKDQLEPIMTNSENIIHFGPNAYAKPATALNILRETVMGRELFDYAFKEYARRWAFRHPTPADFFRTMEDASAVDLDWFWRGWFYSTDPVDIAITNVRHFRLDTKNPEQELALAKEAYERELNNISTRRNRENGTSFAVQRDTSLQDFYSRWDRFTPTDASRQQFQQFYNNLSVEEKAIYDRNLYFYEVDFANVGGLVMPLIIEWTYEDGTQEVERISAYIWRKNENEVTKVFAKDKPVTGIRLDPFRETADIDETNDAWPQRYMPSRFELFQQQGNPRGTSSGSNPMRENRRRQQPAN